MTQQAKYQKESSRTTTTFEVHSLGPAKVATRTNVGPCIVLQMDFSVVANKVAPPASRLFSARIASQEAIPERAVLLAQARISLAGEIDGIYKNELKRLRLEKGWSQMTLASKIGSNQSHIARIESGQSDVQVGTLIMIAQALQVDKERVFTAFAINFIP